MGDFKILMSVALLLLLHGCKMVASRPSGSTEGTENYGFSKDYYALQKIIGKHLEGTSTEKSKVIDLLLQLLEEIDLPTLCEVIINDTKANHNAFLRVPIKYTKIDDDLLNSLDSPITLETPNTEATLQPPSKMAVEADKTTSAESIEQTAVKSNEEEIPARQDGAEDNNVTPATYKYHTDELNNGDQISSQERQYAKDDSLNNENYSEVLSSSALSPGKENPSNDLPGKDWLHGGQIWDSSLLNDKTASVNEDGNPVKAIGDLKQMYLRTHNKNSGEVNAELSGYADDVNNKNILVKQIDVERPRAQLFSQSLVLGDWTNKNKFDRNFLTTYTDNEAEVKAMGMPRYEDNVVSSDKWSDNVKSDYKTKFNPIKQQQQKYARRYLGGQGIVGEILSPESSTPSSKLFTYDPKDSLYSITPLENQRKGDYLEELGSTVMVQEPNNVPTVAKDADTSQENALPSMAMFPQTKTKSVEYENEIIDSDSNEADKRPQIKIHADYSITQELVDNNDMNKIDKNFAQEKTNWIDASHFLAESRPTDKSDELANAEQDVTVDVKIQTPPQSYLTTTPISHVSTEPQVQLLLSETGNKPAVTSFEQLSQNPNEIVTQATIVFSTTADSEILTGNDEMTQTTNFAQEQTATETVEQSSRTGFQQHTPASNLPQWAHSFNSDLSETARSQKHDTLSGERETGNLNGNFVLSYEQVKGSNSTAFLDSRTARNNVTYAENNLLNVSTTTDYPQTAQNNVTYTENGLFNVSTITDYPQTARNNVTYTENGLFNVSTTTDYSQTAQNNVTYTENGLVNMSTTTDYSQTAQNNVTYTENSLVNMSTTTDYSQTAQNNVTYTENSLVNMSTTTDYSQTAQNNVTYTENSLVNMSTTTDYSQTAQNNVTYTENSLVNMSTTTDYSQTAQNNVTYTENSLVNMSTTTDYSQTAQNNVTYTENGLLNASTTTDYPQMEAHMKVANPSAISVSFVEKINVTESRMAGDNNVTQTFVANNGVMETGVGHSEMTHAGIKHHNVTQAGVTNNDITQAGVTHNDVTQAGVTNNDVTQAGVTNNDVTQAGVTNSEITQAGVTNNDVTQAGVTNSEITQAGVTNNVVTQAGVTNSEVAQTEVINNVAQSGITNNYITQVGVPHSDVTQTEINNDVTQTGVTNSEVTQAGVTNSEVTQAGVTTSEVTQTGVTNSEVTQTGVTNSEVTQTGVTNSEVTQAGVSINELMQARITNNNVTQSEVSNNEMTQARVAHADVINANVTNNITNAEVTSNVTNAEVTSNVTDAEVTSNVTDAEVTSNVTIAEITSNVTYADVTSNVTYAEVTSNVTNAEITSNVANAEITSNVTNAEITSNVTNAEITSNVTYAEVTSNVTNAEVTNKDVLHHEVTNNQTTSMDSPTTAPQQSPELDTTTDQIQHTTQSTTSQTDFLPFTQTNNSTILLPMSSTNDAVFEDISTNNVTVSKIDDNNLHTTNSVVPEESALQEKEVQNKTISIVKYKEIKDYISNNNESETGDMVLNMSNKTSVALSAYSSVLGEETSHNKSYVSAETTEFGIQGDVNNANTTADHKTDKLVTLNLITESDFNSKTEDYTSAAPVVTSLFSNSQVPVISSPVSKITEPEQQSYLPVTEINATSIVDTPSNELSSQNVTHMSLENTTYIQILNETLGSPNTTVEVADTTSLSSTAFNSELSASMQTDITELNGNKTEATVNITADPAVDNINVAPKFVLEKTADFDHFIQPAVIDYGSNRADGSTLDVSIKLQSEESTSRASPVAAQNHTQVTADKRTDNASTGIYNFADTEQNTTGSASPSIISFFAASGNERETKNANVDAIQSVTMGTSVNTGTLSQLLRANISTNNLKMISSKIADTKANLSRINLDLLKPLRLRIQYEDNTSETPSTTYTVSTRDDKTAPSVESEVYEQQIAFTSERTKMVPSDIDNSTKVSYASTPTVNDIENATTESTTSIPTVTSATSNSEVITPTFKSSVSSDEVVSSTLTVPSIRMHEPSVTSSPGSNYKPDDLNDFTQTMLGGYSGTFEYSNIPNAYNLYGEDKTQFDRTSMPNSGNWAKVYNSPNLPLNGKYQNKPSDLPYMSQFSDDMDRIKPRTKPVLDSWKAYNIAVGKSKTKANNQDIINQSGAPEIHLYSNYRYTPAPADNLLRSYLWQARPWPKNAIYNQGQSETYNRMLAGQPELYRNQNVDMSKSVNYQTKTLNKIDSSHGQVKKIGNTNIWGDRFRQGYYGRVFDDQSNGLNTDDTTTWPTLHSRDMVNFDMFGDNLKYHDQVQSIKHKYNSLNGNEGTKASHSFDLNQRYRNLMKNFPLYHNPEHEQGKHSNVEPRIPDVQPEYSATWRDASPRTEGQVEASTVPEVEVSSSWKTTDLPSHYNGVPAPGDYTCPGLFGYHKDPKNCQAFFICSWGMAHRVVCPPGTLYNSKEAVCDWAVNIRCTVTPGQ